MNNLKLKLIGTEGEIIDLDKLPSEEPWPIFCEGGGIAGYSGFGTVSYDIKTPGPEYVGISNKKLKNTIKELIEEYPELKKGFYINRFVSGPDFEGFITGYVGRVEFEAESQANSAR